MGEGRGSVSERQTAQLFPLKASSERLSNISSLNFFSQFSDRIWLRSGIGPIVRRVRGHESRSARRSFVGEPR